MNEIRRQLARLRALFEATGGLDEGELHAALRLVRDPDLAWTEEERDAVQGDIEGLMAAVVQARDSLAQAVDSIDRTRRGMRGYASLRPATVAQRLRRSA